MLDSPIADIVIALFGGVVGGFFGLVAGFILAQVFLALLVLGLFVGVDPSFNGLAWAIYVGLATIWICAATGCWYFLRGKHEGAILTAILSAALLAIVFYSLSFSLQFGLLALAFPVARIMAKGALRLQAAWNSSPVSYNPDA
jgi:hypothetical protein